MAGSETGCVSHVAGRQATLHYLGPLPASALACSRSLLAASEGRGMSWLWSVLFSWSPIIAVVGGLVIYIVERVPVIGMRWIDFAERREGRRAQRRERSHS